jgi:hypothetical protein
MSQGHGYSVPEVADMKIKQLPELRFDLTISGYATACALVLYRL